MEWYADWEVDLVSFQVNPVVRYGWFFVTRTHDVLTSTVIIFLYLCVARVGFILPLLLGDTEIIPLELNVVSAPQKFLFFCFNVIPHPFLFFL